MCLGEIQSVSYTHLDVYKRQAVDGKGSVEHQGMVSEAWREGKESGGTEEKCNIMWT